MAAAVKGIFGHLKIMDDWFSIVGSGGELSASQLQQLDDVGFLVIPGPVPSDGLGKLVEVYDWAIAAADADEVVIGGTTTRVHDFVNRGRGGEFDGLYVYPPVLEACCRVIGQPFKLSTMLARTVRAGSRAQGLHVDFKGDADGWPMVGFILMVDEFRSDNGATRFVPGSHKWPANPAEMMKDCGADYEGQVLACGPAGSLIVYNGSLWHGHTANLSVEPRRSIQGAYIRRGMQPGFNFPVSMRPETIARIGPLARYVLGI